MTEDAKAAAEGVERKHTPSEAPADNTAKARAAKRAVKEKGAAEPEATTLAPKQPEEGTSDSAMSRPKNARQLTERAKRNERARSSREGAAAVADPEAVSAIRDALGRLYSVQDVSAALRVTARTTLSYLKSGTLRGRKVGGTWLISEANLKRFVEGE